MAPNVQACPALATVIEELVFINDRTNIPEPSMEDGRRIVWYGAALIPYSIVGTIRVFMGPLPRRIKKPRVLRNFFPCYPGYKPLVFVDAPFDFNFFKNKIFCSSPLTEDVSYI